MCVACVPHSCPSTRAGKLTAAVCLQQSEPRRGSSKTRRDKEKQGCSGCGETFNSITKRRHHCKLCGAVSPGGGQLLGLPCASFLLPIFFPCTQTPWILDPPSKKAGPGGPKGSRLGVSACWTRLLIPLAHGQALPLHMMSHLSWSLWPFQPPSGQSSVPRW